MDIWHSVALSIEEDLASQLKTRLIKAVHNLYNERSSKWHTGFATILLVLAYAGFVFMVTLTLEGIDLSKFSITWVWKFGELKPKFPATFIPTGV